jgi:hypothetical protein
MQLRRCEFCQHGTKVYGAKGRYMICKLIPPHPVVIAREVRWPRPEMALKDFCGQFRLAVSKIFFEHGFRA